MFDHLISFKGVLAVSGAAAGAYIEFPAVPRTDDMQYVFAEPHALIGLVLSEHFLDFVNDQAFAYRAALVRADIPERV
jgi:hypothetical protein